VVYKTLTVVYVAEAFNGRHIIQLKYNGSCFQNINDPLIFRLFDKFCHMPSNKKYWWLV